MTSPLIRTARRKKVVLFLPSRVDPSIGDLPSADLLPLEFLHIAPMAERLGWDVVLIDAMTEPDYLEQTLAACADADVFASSCILGYQVWDSAQVATAVRERFPKIRMIWGGWFPSAIPELYLKSPICDAVAIGQGELTFEEYLKAVEAGEPLDKVQGLALWRDGRMAYTGRRATVHLDELPEPSFHLIDLQKYYDLQKRTARFGHRVRNRLPPPHHLVNKPFRGFSYFSSFGCPEPCTFCNSPGLTERRWKMLPAERLVEHVHEIWKKDPYTGLRFQDANFGPSEKRVAAFCRGLIERDMRITWHTTIEIKQINQYSDETMDLLRDSGLYVVTTGVETASWETQQSIGKRIKPGEALKAIARMDERGIVAGASYIIGFPGETEESMRETLAEARAIKTRFKHASVDVFPYRPIPGAALWQDALDKGYQPPSTARDWGRMFEYKVDSWKGAIPPGVQRDWTVFNFLAPWADGHVRCSPLVKRMLQGSARWRMRTGSRCSRSMPSPAPARRW